jgi:Nucleotidyl transferase AbiEii toxin, Type IV TA system
MQERFYLDSLYPLQDRVLNLLSGLESDFYLTGGTALSRHYLNHRFSDDLDFFFNRSANFKLDTQQAIELIKANFDTEIRVVSESYVQIMVISNDAELKIEFVNDVGYRYDKPISSKLFTRTDHWRNILSNKLTALPREAPKDFVDIIFLSEKFSFNWLEIVEEAKLKDSWVNELQVSNTLGSYSIEKASIVNWVQQPNYNSMQDHLKTIAKDILLGVDNSLRKTQ